MSFVATECEGTVSGSLIARILVRSWRTEVSPVTLSGAGLARIAPQLLATGTASLAWRRLQASRLAGRRAARELRQAYRLHSLGAAMQEENVRAIVPFLRSAGIEPVLVKGWSVARLYPAPALRPYGDLDLFVRPDQFAATEAALARPDAPVCNVDLHAGLKDHGDRGWDEVFSRTQLVQLGDVAVRIPGPEDQLRHLCFHFLRHGAWRPLWLCDVAVALETRPAGFDWDYCLRGSRRQADWIACAIGLAHRLLGARVKDTPVARRARALPSWLPEATLRQWAAPEGRSGGGRAIATYLRRPAGLLQALRQRWPNPIEATIMVRGPFNELPRLPLQLTAYGMRIVRRMFVAPKKV